MSGTAVKVCGVTCEEDARACVHAGVSWIGLNLVASSPRRVTIDDALALVHVVRSAGAEAVAVVADLPLEELLALAGRFDRLQLHGSEPEAVVAAVPNGFKAVRIGTRTDVEAAELFSGEYLLADAKRPGALGGTGAVFDHALVRDLAARRKLLLAGGLTAENVADAVRLVRPALVDVASGVEASGDPRRKDLARVRAFVRAVFEA